MDPSDALRRIAYLLELQDAESFKVKAFRSAAAAIDELPREELATRNVRQLLTIPHVGESSAKVIAAVLAGEAPQYLVRLESELAPIEGPIASLRAALRGDCHGHSDWSDGGNPIREMAETARGLGHEYWSLTDHSPRLTIANGLTAERLRQQLAIVAELNEELAPFRILTGIEVDILDDGSLDQDPGLLAELDVVVASVHSKLRMEEAGMTRRMLAAIEDPNADVLGHCTGRMLGGKRARPQSDFDAEAVFRACAETGTAVEINSSPNRLDPPDDLLALALELGCDFTIDTDAHAPGQLEWQPRGCAKALKVGVPPERIVNTRPLAAFLEWTSGHG